MFETTDLENFWTGLSSGGSKTLFKRQITVSRGSSDATYKHLSSTTLMTDRRPFEASFGVGAAASEPSPKKTVPSSHFVLLFISGCKEEDVLDHSQLRSFANGERSDAN